jgi:hypothetical protein
MMIKKQGGQNLADFSSESEMGPFPPIPSVSQSGRRWCWSKCQRKALALGTNQSMICIPTHCPTLQPKPHCYSTQSAE